MEDIKKDNEKMFEKIKHINEKGEEYWEARELQKALEYSEWRNFEKVIVKAKTNCLKNISNHFIKFNKMVNIGTCSRRKQKDYKLTKYACYLIVQSADAKKNTIVLGQKYFTIPKDLKKTNLSNIKISLEKKE